MFSSAAVVVVAAAAVLLVLAAVSVLAVFVAAAAEAAMAIMAVAAHVPSHGLVLTRESVCYASFRYVCRARRVYSTVLPLDPRLGGATLSPVAA